VITRWLLLAVLTAGFRPANFDVQPIDKPFFDESWLTLPDGTSVIAERTKWVHTPTTRTYYVTVARAKDVVQADALLDAYAHRVSISGSRIAEHGADRMQKFHLPNIPPHHLVARWGRNVAAVVQTGGDQGIALPELPELLEELRSTLTK
jgi:hypothetical protein